MATTDKGPNNVRRDVWALGEFFFHVFLILINVLLSILLYTFVNYEVRDREREMESGDDG